MPNPYLPPESDLPESTPAKSRRPVLECEPRHWFKAICVFLVITPVAIGTILFVLALTGGFVVLLLEAEVASQHFRLVIFLFMTLSAIGGIYTGLKSALETLPLDRLGDEN